MNEGFFALIGVVVGVATVGLKDWLFEKRNRTRRAKYLAIRVVCTLKEYVQGCAEVAGYPGPVNPHVSHVPTPSLAYPEDVDWESISHDLMYRALSLPAKAESAEIVINHVVDFETSGPDGEEGYEERQLQYAQLGLTAGQIANDLRTHYDIPSWDIPGGEPLERLESIKKEIEAQRREDLERRKEALERDPTFMTASTDARPHGGMAEDQES